MDPTIPANARNPTLRLWTPADWPLLLEWANDPAWGRPVITPEEHEAWCQRRRDPLWMAEVDGHPIGYVRFDGWFEPALSYYVAPHARGRGYGAAIIRLGWDAYRAAYPDRLPVARVKPNNIASQRALLAAGWRPVEFVPSWISHETG